MATVAQYYFSDYDSWNAAKSALVEQLGGSSYNTNYDNSYYYIYITSDCDDPGLAADICRGNGGKVY